MDLPAVNAALNATSAVLLTAGYVAVKARRLTLHVTCMACALVVSATFLGCYLYYHFGVRHGESTPFPGTGWVRPVYYLVLLSHIALALPTLGLALTTAFLGWRGRYSRHTRLGRWTLPVWLYVSITGVVVYWMLYRLYPAGSGAGKLL